MKQMIQHEAVLARGDAARRTRATDAVAGYLRERARAAFDSALEAHVLYETSSASAGPDDTVAYLRFVAFDEVASALRCVLGWYVAYGDDPVEKLKRYVHDEDLDEAVFRERIEEEVAAVARRSTLESSRGG